MKRTNFLSLAAIAVLFVAPTLASATDIFTFANYTFNQLNTPDKASLIGSNAVLGGATFSAGLPSSVTSTINFPGTNGFNSARALGPLTGLSTNSVRAVNLPNGNNGTSTRHGIEVSWPNHVLPNAAGPDFVIYESGSTSNAVEGVMIRVHTTTNDWSDWFYFAPTSYQITTGAEVLFAYAIDSSNLGTANGAYIDKIQLANLMAADRISTTNPVVVGTNTVGQGKVVFDGSSVVLPDAGLFDADRVFDSTTFDPDPLYVAALHDVCELTAPKLAVARFGTSVTVTWPAPSCYSLQQVTVIGSTNSWEVPVEAVSLSNGLMTATVTITPNASRFFRLYRP